MINGLLTYIGSLFTSIFQLLGSAFNGVVSLFWIAGESGAAGTPTILLEVIGFGAAASVVGAVIYVIVRLIKGALARVRSGANAAK